MENLIFIVVWVVVVCVVRAIGKNQKTKTDDRPAPRPWNRPDRRSGNSSSEGLPADFREIFMKGESGGVVSRPSNHPDDCDDNSWENSLPPEYQKVSKKKQSSVPAELPLSKTRKSSPPAMAQSHAGESYASPIPKPYSSPMVGKKSPALRHADAHVAPVNVKDTLKQHGPSATAKHADEHIATTYAAPTPQSETTQRKSPLADWIPQNGQDLRKALVMSEIIGAPKSLR